MKRVILAVVLLIVGFLGWYLFIKPYDYLVTFKVKAIPGTINQMLKLDIKRLQNSRIIANSNLRNIKQEVVFNDSTFVFDWEIVPVTDSTSKVRVYIKNEEHSIKNKLQVPFFNTDFKIRSVNTVSEFAHDIEKHIKSFKVTINGKDQLSGVYCIYVPIKSSQRDKANEMMKYYPDVSDFMVINGIKSKGNPFVEVTDWDMKNDSIQFNFCFPIIRKDSLPKNKLLRYKQFDGLKQAVKATYNGNYITSDRAWYALINYAKKNNMKISETPVEVFHNNPNMGGDSMHWKTEVFMPIK